MAKCAGLGHFTPWGRAGCYFFRGAAVAILPCEAALAILTRKDALVVFFFPAVAILLSEAALAILTRGAALLSFCKRMHSMREATWRVSRSISTSNVCNHT